MKPFDSTGQFQGLDQNAGKSGRTVRNVGITIFSQGCVFALQMLAMTILARILAPADFGLVTMVTTFSLLFASFGVAGLTDAILQARTINHSLASNLFWFNIGGGILLAGAFGGGGSLLAKFYDNPRITQVAVGFSLAIFFSIAPVVHIALLKRGMRFGAASVNDIVGRFANVFTAIFLALHGWGYWALVAGAVIQPLVIAVGACVLCPWRPGLPKRVEDTGRMVRYALDVYGRFTLNYGTGNIDNLLVGWRFGAMTLGFYKKAFDIFVLPSCQLLSPIVAVVVTALSRRNQDREDFKNYFLKALAMVAFVGMAASADLTLVSKDIIRVLMGKAWGESGRIFTYFAPGIGLMLIYQTTAWIHLSLGTTARWLRWTVFELSVTVMLFLLALRWGPIGIAGAWTTSFFVLMIPGFWYAGKPIGLSLGAVIETIWRYMLAALLAGIATAAILATVHWLPLFALPGVSGATARIVTNSTLFSLLYLGAIVILFGSFEPLRQVIQLLPDLLPGVSSLRRSRSARQAEDTAMKLAVVPETEEVTCETK